MWSNISTWLQAGSPAHWVQVGAFVIYSVWELWLGKTDKTKAGSTLELMWQAFVWPWIQRMPWFRDLPAAKAAKAAREAKKMGGSGGGGPTCAAVFFPLFIALSLFQTSCACWKAEHKDEPMCVVEHQVVDCTVGDVKSLGPAVAGIIMQFISGTTDVDWGGIDQRLEGLGFRDAGCILAQLQNDFATKQQATPMMMAKAKASREHFSSWKDKHKVAQVKFKVAGGTL